MIEQILWTGYEYSDAAAYEFLRQGRPNVIFWFEGSLYARDGGLGSGPSTLVIAYQLNTAPPLRVEPMQWVHWDGSRFRLGRGRGGESDGAGAAV